MSEMIYCPRCSEVVEHSSLRPWRLADPSYKGSSMICPDCFEDVESQAPVIRFCDHCGMQLYGDEGPICEGCLDNMRETTHE